MTTLVLLTVAILLFTLMARAIRTLLQDSPRHRDIRLQPGPRLDGDTET